MFAGDKLLKEPEKELFLWCVLMHRKDLAMCFWEEGNVSNFVRLLQYSCSDAYTLLIESFITVVAY